MPTTNTTSGFWIDDIVGAAPSQPENAHGFFMDDVFGKSSTARSQPSTFDVPARGLMGTMGASSGQAPVTVEGQSVPPDFNPEPSVRGKSNAQLTAEAIAQVVGRQRGQDRGLVGETINAAQRATARGSRAVAGLAQMVGVPLSDEMQAATSALPEAFAPHQLPPSAGPATQVAYWLANTAGEAGPSLAPLALGAIPGPGPALATAAMVGQAGLDSAGNTFVDATQRGVDPATARAEALFSGGASAILNALPAGQMASKIVTNNPAVKAALGRFISSEGGQHLMNAVIGSQVNGATGAADATMRRVMQAAFENDPEAFANLPDEALQAWLGGTVVGGAIESRELVPAARALIREAQSGRISPQSKQFSADVEEAYRRGTPRPNVIEEAARTPEVRPDAPPPDSLSPEALQFSPEQIRAAQEAANRQAVQGADPTAQVPEAIAQAKGQPTRDAFASKPQEVPPVEGTTPGDTPPVDTAAIDQQAKTLTEQLATAGREDAAAGVPKQPRDPAIPAEAYRAYERGYRLEEIRRRQNQPEIPDEQPVTASEIPPREGVSRPGEPSMAEYPRVGPGADTPSRAPRSGELAPELRDQAGGRDGEPGRGPGLEPAEKTSPHGKRVGPAEAGSSPVRAGESIDSTGVKAPESFLDRIEREAMERSAQRKLTRSRDPRRPAGSTILGGELRDTIIIAAARVAKAGVKTAEAIQETIRKVADELGVKLEGTARLAREVRTILKDSGPDHTEFDSALVKFKERHPDADAAQPVKQTIREKTEGPAPEKTITEPQALKATMRAQERAGREGFKEGVAEGRAREQAAQQPKRTLKQIIAETTGLTDAGDEATVSKRAALRASLKAQARAAKAAREEAMDSARESIRTLRTQMRDKIASQEEARKTVSDIIESALPPSERGTFLAMVRNAKTGLDVTKAVMRVEDRINQMDVKRFAKVAREFNTKKLIRTIPLDDRPEVQKNVDALLRKVGEDKAGRTGRELTRNALRIESARIDEMREHVAAIKQAKANADAERKTQQIGAARSVIQAKAIAKANVAKSAEPIPGDPEILEDRGAGSATKNPVRRFAEAAQNLTLYGDMMNVAERLEGASKPSDRVIAPAFERLQLADNKRLGRERDAIAALEKQMPDLGYKDLADARIKTEGLLGESQVERVRVKLGGDFYKLRKDQLIEIAAHLQDADTRKLLAEGMPFAMADGTSKPVTATLAELEAAVAQLSPKERQAADAVIGWIADMRPAIADAAYKLTGTAPVLSDKYVPRTRDVIPNELRSPDEAVAAMPDKWNRLKDRTGGTTKPMIIKGIWNLALDYAKESSSLIEMGGPVRDAHNILKSKSLRDQIAERYGPRMVDRLDEFLLNAAGMDKRERTIGGQIVSDINGIIASSNIVLRPTTMSMQVASTTRLIPDIGIKGYLEGVAGAGKVSMQELRQANGYFWERFTGDPYRRLSAIASDSTGTSTGVGRALKATGINLKDTAVSAITLRGKDAGKHFGDAYDSYKRAVSGIKVLDWFDGLIARIAYAHYKAEALRESPNRSPRQVMEWAGEKAAQVVRKNANASGHIDHATNQIRTRGTGSSAFLLFASDGIKTWNNVQRDWRAGVGKGIARTAVELFNLGFAAAVRGSVPLAIAYLGAKAVGNQASEEKAAMRAKDWRYWAHRLGKEIAGQAAPNFGDKAYALGKVLGSGDSLGQADLMDVPAFSLAQDMGKTATAAQRVVNAWSKDDQKAARKALDDFLLKGATTGSTLAGNPLSPFVQYGAQAYRAAEADPDRRFFYKTAVEHLQGDRIEDAAKALRVLIAQHAKASDRRAEKEKIERSLVEQGPRKGRSQAEWEAHLKDVGATDEARRRELKAADRAWREKAATAAKRARAMVVNGE